MKLQKLSLLLVFMLVASAQATISTPPNSPTPNIKLTSTPIISISPTQSQVYGINPPDNTKNTQLPGWNSIEYFVSSILLFLLGLFMLNGGIRIIKNKKFYSASRVASSVDWQARLITGKAAIHEGTTFIATGIIIIIISIYLLTKGVGLVIS